MQELTFEYADGVFTRVLDGMPTSEQEQVLTDLLRDNPGVLTGAFDRLAMDQGVSRKIARQYLETGIADGSVRQETIGRKGKGHFLVEGVNTNYIN